VVGGRPYLGTARELRDKWFLRSPDVGRVFGLPGPCVDLGAHESSSFTEV